jgi:hypothetical protein
MSASLHHFGITVPGTVAPFACYEWDDCAHHMDVSIAGGDNARSGRFQFTNRAQDPNGAGNCESTTLFVRNVTAEWYGDDTHADDAPSLADLVPGGTRHPVGVGRQTSAALSIPPGGSDVVKVSLGQPSGRTGHVVVNYTVGTSATADPNTDTTESALLQISPGHGDIPTLSEWGMLALFTLLLLAGGLLIRKRSIRTTIA